MNDLQLFASCVSSSSTMWCFLLLLVHIDEAERVATADLDRAEVIFGAGVVDSSLTGRSDLMGPTSSVKCDRSSYGIKYT